MRLAVNALSFVLYCCVCVCVCVEVILNVVSNQRVELRCSCHDEQSCGKLALLARRNESQLLVCIRAQGSSFRTWSSGAKRWIAAETPRCCLCYNKATQSLKSHPLVVIVHELNTLLHSTTFQSYYEEIRLWQEGRWR